ncbi:LUD domain-containing protein [Halobellus ordinarius]|uniref:LUD domain-containing protein n=1 Tax=Halobellus ordinarius TaxID=3075120 RepID=UPI00288092A8|nr:LUD domain-containing protein [Halobellus sp. ZY16]
MEIDSVDGFASSLSEAGVEYTRTTAREFETALSAAIELPAVGAPLGLDSVSLGETDVQLPPTPRLLLEAETGVTRVHGGVIEHGSFVIQSDEAGTEPVSLYPRKHVGVIRASDLQEDFDATASWLDGEFQSGRDSAIVATGASATADMGKIVDGVHGPQTVHAIILTDR